MTLVELLRRRGREWKTLAKEFAEVSEKNEWAKIDQRFVYLRARARFIEAEDKRLIDELNQRGATNG